VTSGVTIRMRGFLDWSAISVLNYSKKSLLIILPQQVSAGSALITLLAPCGHTGVDSPFLDIEIL
jgi:hypothetical protein